MVSAVRLSLNSCTKFLSRSVERLYVNPAKNLSKKLDLYERNPKRDAFLSGATAVTTAGAAIGFATISPAWVVFGLSALLSCATCYANLKDILSAKKKN